MFNPFPIELKRIGKKILAQPEQSFLIEIDHKNRTALVQRADRSLQLLSLEDVDVLGTFALMTNEPSKIIRPA